ncbi:MAG: sulfur carrier protein ThiS adenylyltransferase ThiF [Lachnotalea sp.]
MENNITKAKMEELLVSRNTPQVYEKVKVSRVGIAGLGGLGSHVAIALARTGVGHLHLVDFDVVEPSNLNRQEYRMRHLGLYKTEALKSQIEEINPYVTVTINTQKITKDNAMDIFQDDDIVCEAFDLPEQKAMLVNTLLENRSDIKIVSGSGMAGYASNNIIKTRKVMKNLYLCGDEMNGLKPGWGLMAPRVSICAGHEANTVLRLILGEEGV